MTPSDLTLAQLLAERYHGGQKYGDEPYTRHLRDVATSVAEGSTDERLIVVAWLHDILEDTSCSAGTLFSLFEDNIVNAVIALTRGATVDKEPYLEACKRNPMARVVKIHDSLCNLRASVMRMDAKRVKKYSEQISFLISE